ncbi:hypothetical protein U1Q18_041901 [Sarracenia purpurea var. burkii]
MNRKFRKRNFTNQVGVSVNLDSDGNLPPLAGTKETVNTASRLSIERTRHQVFRDVADLRVNLLTMVNDCSVSQKLARVMVSTATDLEEEVIQVKKENAPFGSSRMTALVARIKRLKGISPIRINEFATELNWSTIITQATPAETKGFPELTVEGPASFVNDNKVNSDPTSCEFDPGNIGPVSLEVEPVLAVTGKQAVVKMGKPYYAHKVFDKMSKPISSAVLVSEGEVGVTVEELISEGCSWMVLSIELL